MSMRRAITNAVSVVMIVASAVSATATPTAAAGEPTDPLVVEGTLLINGVSSWAGIELRFEWPRVDDSVVLCGSGETADGGEFSMTFDPACNIDATIEVVLTQLDDRQTTDVKMPQPVDDVLRANPSFRLSENDLAQLPSPSTSEEGGSAADEALRLQSESIFDEVERLLIVLLAAGTILLTVMAIAIYSVTSRRYRFLDDSIAEMVSSNKQNGKEASSASAVADVLTAESATVASRLQIFRWMVEGLVLSFVVIALIALGAAGKVDAQGTVSILAAMVGYAAGRAMK